MGNFANLPLLVTGASGNLGRAAVEELLARGATNVIAGTRDPAKLADLAARGVEVRKVDFDDANLAAALSGVVRMLIVSTDGIGRRVAQQTAAVEAAKAAGVKHIVYTSAPAARPDADAGLGPEHFWTEVALASSGLDFTILRNHFYSEARRARFHGDYDEGVAERILRAPASQEAAVELSDVLRALSVVPDTYREALILVAIGSLSYEEIADICGIALGTVKSRICRARAMLSHVIASGQLPDFRHNFVLTGGAVDAFFAELARIANPDASEVQAA